MVLSKYGDAAQIARVWGMQLKIKGTVITPFSLYVLTLFAHSYNLTLMVQHNESRGGQMLTVYTRLWPNRPITKLNGSSLSSENTRKGPSQHFGLLKKSFHRALTSRYFRFFDTRPRGYRICLALNRETKIRLSPTWFLSLRVRSDLDIVKTVFIPDLTYTDISKSSTCMPTL